MDAHLASLPKGGQDALGTNWGAGDIMYRDLNGDGKISDGATLNDPGDKRSSVILLHGSGLDWI